MSDSSKRDKPASIASFLFLPQFGKMFGSSSYLIPVFIRTIANLYVQADLLPPTHPAANYGAPGVEKCSFSKMMGDAWYTIRSTAATPYQWSVFCSVLLMIFVLVSSVIVTALNLSVTFISSAAAQVFTGPLGPNTTDIQSIPGLPGPCTANTPFCRMIPPVGGGHGDYAIDILDKMLRRGASGTPALGGPLQDATGALMEVYNSGVLVVAGVMLFWLIISVVVDIAKTGQIGGGRHNLVWAPIRIVFALALMIPLGTTGFSSGQFMVMKLAEWGSNFGTNGWNAYLGKIAQSANLVPALPLGDDLMPLAGAYERMWICRVAHNGYGMQAEGIAFIQPTIAQEVFNHGDVSEPDKGQASYAFTNNTANDLCGRVVFPTGNDPALLALINPPAGSTPDPVAVASAQFKIAMDKVWMGIFVSNYPFVQSSLPGVWTSNDQQPLALLANKFACGFVAQHIWGQVVGGMPVLWFDCSQYPAPQCGSGAEGTGKYPNMSCVDNNTNELDTGTLTGAIGAPVYQAATANLNLLKALPVTALFGTRGWADMGSFYKSISTLTLTVRGSMKIPVNISAPAIQDSSDNQSAKVQEVLGKYDDWWKTVPNGQPGPTAPQPIRAHHGGGGFWGGLVHIAKAAVGGVVGAVGTVVHAGEDVVNGAKLLIGVVSDFASNPATAILKEVSKISRDLEGTSFLGIPDANDPTTVNDYPLQIVSNAGGLLIDLALGMYTVITGLELLAAAVPTVDLGATIATSMLGHLMSIIGDLMLTCGTILMFYLPLLPFIRVAHAVLTWMVAVFEAVMLVPIAALSFLDTEHEGMYNKLPFVNWLDILVRPMLTVIGFVGSILVFDTFFAYFQDSFGKAVSAEVAGTNILFHFIAMFVNSMLFTLIMYTAANTCFKLLTTIPNSFFRWIPGAQPSSFQEDGGDHSGAVGKMGGLSNSAMMKGSGAENRMRKGIQAQGKPVDKQNNNSNPQVEKK